MAVLQATTANIDAVVSDAQPGDEVSLSAGTYYTLPRKSGITMTAHDWAEGRFVTDTTGHNGAGCSVIYTGPLHIGEDDFTLRGVYHDTSGYSSINAGVITGNNVTLADCVSNARRKDGGRQIGYTIGTGTSRVSGFRYLRCRHLRTGQAGQDLDHAIYLKNAAGWLVEDCIITDGGRFPLHLYTNADSGLVDRTIVWNSVGGITFSGASDSSTGTSVYGTSDDNTVRNSIIGLGRKGYLIESWTSDSSRPVSGNVVRDSIITPAGGGAGTVKPGMSGVIVENCPDIDPGFADWRNGDFRNASGYGPAYLQTADPAPPPSEPPPPAPPDLRVSAELRDLIMDRLAQQKGRAATVRGPEYVGRLRERGLNGLADALDRNVGQAIWNNADAIERLLIDAEEV